MAYRLLSRTKSLATKTLSCQDLAPLTFSYHRSLLIPRRNNPTASTPTATQLLSRPIPLPYVFYKNLHDVRSSVASKEETNSTKSKTDGSHKVFAASPLENITAMKELKSALKAESLKTRRMAQFKKITYALIPALLVLSTSNFLSSILVLSVYWQIYAFYKEIFLDYIHQEVTRQWVLNYFAILLVILAKDTLVYYDLV